MVSLLRKHSALEFKVFNISLGNLMNVLEHLFKEVINPFKTEAIII